MPGKVDPDSLGFLITDTSRLLRATMERRLTDAGLGITAGEARALLHIGALDGQRQNVIAERMGIEPMTFSTYVDRLERIGLVIRDADPSDRRAKLVTTTPNADRMIAKIREYSGALLNEIQEGLEPAEKERLRPIMKTLRANLQALLVGAEPQPARKTGTEG
jgi:DNA-binding MarR family transcriptional regulator